MPNRLKQWSVNGSLAIVAFLLSYILTEYVTFRVFLPDLPRYAPFIPDVFDILAQNTKGARQPHDYVALLGDSYAEGFGDWLSSHHGDRTAPFHSANIIHDATGRDIVSFGKAGAGSAEGLVLRPARIVPETRCSVLPAIEEPRQILVYFYEGNDIQDNLRFLGKVRRRYGSIGIAAIDRYLSEVYAAPRPWRCQLELLMATGRALEFVYKQYILGRRPLSEAEPTSCIGRQLPANRIAVGEYVLDAPPLQGPALDIPDDGVQLAFDVFARSLAWLRHRFGQVQTTIVYVPSPLTIYRELTDKVVHCSFEAKRSAPATEVQKNSDLLAERVRTLALGQGMGFTDARPGLRAAAADTTIHGPRDWDHLNEAGYRALGRLVAPLVVPTN
jgi:hypothetical protein